MKGKSMSSKDVHADADEHNNRKPEEKNEDGQAAPDADNRKGAGSGRKAPEELGKGSELDATPPDATHDILPPDSKVPGEPGP
jgi:hypothetical protein